jgi:DNA mismatch repair protein MutS2
MRQLQAEGVVDDDVSVSVRDGRPVIPVSSANKKKINGIVHDESATGKTSFIEPAEIVEMNNRLRELMNSEKREIIKILLDFTVQLRPYYDDLINSYMVMGKIDFIRSKAVFAKQFECSKPVVKPFPFFDWYQAKHPLLMQALKKENREVVPLNLRLDDPNRILLISGPNAGGKSVCLKTVGILQYMFQCGMLVSMSEGSAMGIFESIFIDIGDEQSLENDLSTYSSHLLNMKFFTRKCSPKSLILIDEFGTGTEPLLGGAIAEAVLNKLNKLETFGVITTHYTNLKHFGSSTKGLVNGAMLYDSQGMRPLFQLQIGKPGSSFAFEIARKIGLDNSILQEATDKLGQEHIDYDKHLREIVRDKQYWETKRNKIRKTEKTLDELSENYNEELSKVKQQRKDIIAQAKAEAQRIISDANKAVENTIKEIRESQADKDKTRDIRKKLVEFKDEIEKIDPDKELQVKREMDKVLSRQLNKGSKKTSLPNCQNPLPKSQKEQCSPLAIK